ncbi:HIRAN domain-containing protein [Pseudomonas protegens]|uniref:HIRAN domain-containing protein n=1 Tax=Pseudomonas protegens TaxID=380021 RepID=UPI000F4B71B1
MSRRPGKLQCVDLPPLTGRIRGTTSFGFHVVGESYFQAELRHIRNNMSVAYENNLEAFIVTEPNNPHDKNACAVYIDSFKVGYLPRDAAKDYVTQMRGNGVFGESCFQIRAKLIGGLGERPNIGVLLNLPTGG